MSRSLPHLTMTTSTSSLSPISPIFPTFSPTQPSPLAHDPYLSCEDPGQSGGSTQIPSLTGYEPKVIEPEDLEPRRIELDWNLGRDPYRTQERIVGDDDQNPVAEDMDKFGKVGVEMSYIHSQMHSDYHSAECIADSDREDGELRKMLASPVYIQCEEKFVVLFENPQLLGNQKQKIDTEERDELCFCLFTQPRICTLSYYQRYVPRGTRHPGDFLSMSTLLRNSRAHCSLFMCTCMSTRLKALEMNALGHLKYFWMFAMRRRRFYFAA